jgi:hypothetical protein
MIGRIARATRALAPEQRLAGVAAIALWLAMFLPWYSKSTTYVVKGSPKPASYSVSAFGAFSFVEAAVLLVSAGVLFMLFARGERRAFHLPGGDGLIVMLAGIWTGVLIFYRMLDKPGTTGNATLTTTIGIQWGIFIALFAAIALAWAGTRIRAAHRPEPALAEDPTVSNRVVATPPPGDGQQRRAAARRLAPADEETTRVAQPGSRATLSREEAEQLSFDVPGEVERDPFGDKP